MSQNKLDITHRSVWKLALPLILSNLTVPLVGAVDTAVMGHLPGPHYMGAVALGALIFSFLYWGFGFLRMGTTGFIARAVGANDQSLIEETLLRVIVLALLLGCIVVVLQSLAITLSLHWLEASERVESLTRVYFDIRIWSAPATLTIYALNGVLIGLQNTRGAFILLFALNLVNIILDILFVPIMGMSIEGVAWATLIAEYSAVACGVFLLRQQLISAIRNVTVKQIFETSALKVLMTANSQIFLRTLCLVFSFAYFTAQSARLGEVVLAANTVLLHFQTMMAYGLDGFAHAAEALAGSAYGAKKKDQFKKAVKLTTGWAAITATLTCVIYLIFNDELLALFTNIDTVIEVANQQMIWAIIAPLISVWSFQLDGIFIGTSHTKEMLIAMLASTILYVVIIHLSIPVWGNHGLFFALACFMVIRAITLGLYYPRITESLEKSKP